jgi:hypothetical protein
MASAASVRTSRRSIGAPRSWRVTEVLAGIVGRELLRLEQIFDLVIFEFP